MTGGSQPFHAQVPPNIKIERGLPLRYIAQNCTYILIFLMYLKLGTAEIANESVWVSAEEDKREGMWLQSSAEIEVSSVDRGGTMGHLHPPSLDC